MRLDLMANKVDAGSIGCAMVFSWIEVKPQACREKQVDICPCEIQPLSDPSRMMKSST